LAVWGAAGPLRAVDYDKPAPGSEKLTAEQTNGLLVFRWNNRTVGAYRAQSTQKFPYFYPLCGPATGVSLLAESALPYPHHRGLWLGCQPMNEGDYWGDTSLDKGHIRSTQLQLGKATPESAVFTNACEWIRKDAPSPLEDKRTFTIHAADNKLWWMDADLTLTARQDIAIKQAKHSFFALRVIPQISPLYGGVLSNSEGAIGAEGTYCKPARWCGYHGKSAGDMVEGLVRLANSDERLPVNLGNPVELTILEFGERIQRLMGIKTPIVHQPLPSDDPKRRQPNIAKAKRLLGWEPKVGLEEGLRETVEYFKKRLAIA
jgi:hypothetical protein